ncbi:MAG: response regulator [Ignavibacteria bacterium]|nr:response regulator [Ignavibacteria bacterium]
MKKILLIEDDPKSRSNIKYLLEANNYNVFSAEDGDEGIKLAKEIKPDLVISDILMPVVDGYKVKEELSTNPKTSSIPFIFLSAKSDLRDIRKGMNLGADDYLTKPFKIADLLKAIEARITRIDEIGKQINGAKEKLIEKNSKKLDRDDVIFIEVANKPTFIKISTINYISAMGEYSKVYLKDGKKLMVRKLIKQWDEILPQNLFLRVHRSTIINIDSIKKIEKWFKRSFVIHLENSVEPVYMSERYARKLRSQVQF